ncbi:MAG: rhomboid family intramembrane serine protease [Planctomycetota bacterium]|nr:rhomboid family intramembrane serine protease [Planctomycetota bacterium]
MRQIGTVSEAAKAGRFIDFLLTERIDSKVTEGKAGWEVWVVEEDRVSQARIFWEKFLANPEDESFARAGGEAKRLRQLERKQDDAYDRKQAIFTKKLSRGEGAVQDPVTVILLVVSAVVFVVTMPSTKKALLDWLWFSVPELTDFPGPAWVPKSARLPLASVLRGEVWRLISPIFIHMGWVHLVFNMLMLVSVGAAVERVIGSWAIALLVLGLAVISNTAEAVFGPGLHFGGMSGVLYGLAGFSWVMGMVAPQRGLQIDRNTALILVGWLLLGVLMDQPDLGVRMANWAHGVGLAAGVLAGKIVGEMWVNRS